MSERNNNWRKSRDGFVRTNIRPPKEFWRQNWDKSKRAKAGVVAIRGGNEVLLVQSYHKYYGFPKGHVDDNEFFITAAGREFYEETGTFVDLRYAFVMKYKKNTVFYIILLPYDFEIKTHPTTKYEVTAMGWESIEKIQDYYISNNLFNDISKKVWNKLLNYIEINDNLYFSLQIDEEYRFIKESEKQEKKIDFIEKINKEEKNNAEACLVGLQFYKWNFKYAMGLTIKSNYF